MNPSQFKEWETKQNYLSFKRYSYSVKDDYEFSSSEKGLLELPYTYQILLNKHGEVKIGDYIVWYDQGSKYYIPANKPELRKKIKIDKSLPCKKDNYTIDRINLKNIISGLSTARNTVNLGLNGVDARYQRTFSQQSPVQGCRKYVHELKSILDGWYSYSDPGCGSGYSYYTRLYLQIKMEYARCGSSNWRPAGEERAIRWNLNKYIRLRGVVRPCSQVEDEIVFSGIDQWEIPMALTHTSQLNLLLGSNAGNTANGNVYWQIDLSGWIYQHIVGDVQSNEWNHQGNPFW